MLHVSESCLQLIRDEQYDELEESITEYQQLLMDYLNGTDVTALDEGQQSMLIKINSNHQAVISQMEIQKKNLGEQIGRLQKGRQLSKTYGGWSGGR